MESKNMETSTTFDYAFLNENHIVTHVLKFDNPSLELLNQTKEHLGSSYFILCEDFGTAHKDGDFFNNKFYPKKPYPSWIRNEELNEWEAPILQPGFDEENPKYYQWNEDILNWEEIQVSE